MISRLALRLSLSIVRAVGWLVPAAVRADWIREWEAELQYRSTHSAPRPAAMWRANLGLVGRALGSLPDAAWIRRQFTLDADAVHDAVHGLRLLARTPGFTAIALAVFALGIGATTAIVSVADARLLRPLAVSEPEQVMTVRPYDREAGLGQ